MHVYTHIHYRCTWKAASRPAPSEASPPVAVIIMMMMMNIIITIILL